MLTSENIFRKTERARHAKRETHDKFDQRRYREGHGKREEGHRNSLLARRQARLEQSSTLVATRSDLIGQQVERSSSVTCRRQEKVVSRKGARTRR